MDWLSAVRFFTGWKLIKPLLWRLLRQERNQLFEIDRLEQVVVDARFG